MSAINSVNSSAYQQDINNIYNNLNSLEQEVSQSGSGANTHNPTETSTVINDVKNIMGSLSDLTPTQVVGAMNAVFAKMGLQPTSQDEQIIQALPELEKGVVPESLKPLLAKMVKKLPSPMDEEAHKVIDLSQKANKTPKETQDVSDATNNLLQSFSGGFSSEDQLSLGSLSSDGSSGFGTFNGIPMTSSNILMVVAMVMLNYSGMKQQEMGLAATQVQNGSNASLAGIGLGNDTQPLNSLMQAYLANNPSGSSDTVSAALTWAYTTTVTTAQHTAGTPWFSSAQQAAQTDASNFLTQLGNAGSLIDNINVTEYTGGAAGSSPVPFSTLLSEVQSKLTTLAANHVAPPTAPATNQTAADAAANIGGLLNGAIAGINAQLAACGVSSSNQFSVIAAPQGGGMQDVTQSDITTISSDATSSQTATNQNTNKLKLLLSELETEYSSGFSAASGSVTTDNQLLQTLTRAIGGQ